MKQSDLKLGLIGDNIAHSRAPLLHELAGKQNGILVQYDRLVPRDLGKDFDALFDHCATSGYRGINVTYPYKERAATKVKIDDPHIKALGAVNTVLFDGGQPRGANTDYTGFMASYRHLRPHQEPGITCLIGTGGVGRALAFALATLGSREIRLIDKDPQKASSLANDLRELPKAPSVKTYRDAAPAVNGANGILNGTPIGMIGYDGCPIEEQALKRALEQATWVFDAVYTPIETRFLQIAKTSGAQLISGYELFFHQGIHAWEQFSGTPVDQHQLRADLEFRGEKT